MASTPTDRTAHATALGGEREPEWETEMQVTFDSAELSSFFDGFDPLEVLGDPDSTGSEHR